MAPTLDSTAMPKVPGVMLQVTEGFKRLLMKIPNSKKRVLFRLLITRIIFLGSLIPNHIYGIT